MAEPIKISDQTAPNPTFDNLLTDEVKNRILEFLRFLFSRSDQYTWVDDEIQSKIAISDIFPQKEDIGKKPAVVVRRGNLILTNRSVGHFQGWTFSKNFGSRFMDLLQSQVVIECYSREGLEAEKIANFIFMGLLFFRKRLREVGRVHDILAGAVGSEVPQRVSSEITLSMVPVEMSFSFSENWTTEQVGEDLFNSLVVRTVSRKA